MRHEITDSQISCLISHIFSLYLSYFVRFNNFFGSTNMSCESGDLSFNPKRDLEMAIPLKLVSCCDFDPLMLSSAAFNKVSFSSPSGNKLPISSCAVISGANTFTKSETPKELEYLATIG